jgi:acyl-CoA synthetase (AMP-forming)/AMP-acid ligase II
LDRTRECTIREWIEQGASAQGDALALSDLAGGVQLSFRDLAGRVEALAGEFRAFGIGRETRVAVSLVDGPETVTILLALMSIAAVLPIHPTAALAPADALVEKVGVSVIVGGARPSSAAWKIAEARGLLYVEVTGPAGAPGEVRLTAHRGVKDPSRAVAGLDDIALFIPTSGTTGRSSVVAITQRSLDCNVATHGRLNGYGPGTRALCVMGFTYLFAYVRAALPTLRLGGAVAVGPGYRFADVKLCCETFRPNTMAATPTILQKFIADAEAGHWRPQPGVLTRFHATGEAIPDALRARLGEVFCARLGTNYGMTEVSPQVAVCRPEDAFGPGAAGRIVPPWSADILGDDGAVLPAGAIGRIALRGGYVNAIVDAEDGRKTRIDQTGRLLTGDRGYFDAAGVLYIVGRADDVVNRGGEKLDPKPIEQALERDPDVARAVVFGVADAKLGQKLLGLVVLREGATRGPQQISEAAGARISGWSMPERLVVVSEIPVNANGKVSRRDLAARFSDG